MVVLDFTDPQFGSKTHCIIDGATTWSATLLDTDRITGHASVQSRCEDGLLVQGSVEIKNCIVNRPVAEVSQGLQHHQCVQLRKSVYGVTDAPRAWWERVEKDMTSQGCRTLTTEPCFWVKTSSDGRVHDLAIAYVDDVLIAADEELHDWRPWEHVKFTQCGVQIEQSCHEGRWGGFLLSC